MHSIRVKISLITIAAILTTILSVFAASYSIIQVETDRRAAPIMNLLRSDTAKTLERYFDDVEQSTEMVANLSIDTLNSVFLVENGVSGFENRQSTQTDQQREKLDRYIREHCDSMQEAFESVAIHTHGVISYYYCISPNVSVTEHGFYYSKVGKPGFGKNAPLNPADFDPNDPTHSDWYYETVRRGRPTWTGPYPASTLSELVICSFNVPIYKAGALIGIIGMDMPFDTIVDTLNSIKVFETGYVILIDPDGDLLYHPDQKNSVTDASELVLSDFSVLLKESSGDELIKYELNGVERQMSFCTLSNGMKLVLSAPSSEINASWSQLTRMLLIISAAMIFVFSLLLMFVMRLITRPLKNLTDASQRLAAADYDVELNYESKDEIGVLTGAFKGMRDQLKLYIEDLNRRINTDALTGLPNMRHFFELAEEERKVIAESGQEPVILFFNLIGMKHYNRQFGFDRGDRLICAVAEILVRRCGENRVGRFGQDNFCVIAPKEGLEHQLSELDKEFMTADRDSALPVRVGVYPLDLDDVNISVACDRAKYACDKHRGAYLSGITYFDSEMLRQLENVRYVINNLDRAIEERWIKVYYQPIIRASNGHVCDEEALSRWIDPEKGMLSPADFIPILERARLIYKLDLYMLDRILEHMQIKQKEGMWIVPQSLNLSRSDFDNCDVVEEIRRRVDEAGVSRDKLTIEITESMVGSDFDFMKRQIQRFQELGFQVWMDDFGSGYSSLDVLQDIHFDLLKFDMRFMHRFNESHESKIILTELIRMAQSMGIDTICEGVETKEQVDFLREIGCTKLQGYYFSRPLPLEEIIHIDKRGPTFGFENPEESAYYEDIGKVSLYDIEAVASEDGGSFRSFFNTLPMGVMEIKDDRLRYVRTNQPYRNFMKRFYGFDLDALSPEEAEAPIPPESAFARLVSQCCGKQNMAFFDEHMPDGAVIHSFVRRVSDNPVTGAVAVSMAVLSITDKDERTTYATLAQEMDAGYFDAGYNDDAN